MADSIKAVYRFCRFGFFLRKFAGEVRLKNLRPPLRFASKVRVYPGALLKAICIEAHPRPGHALESPTT